MDISWIYLCNGCEKIGFEVLTGISNFHKEKSIAEQIYDKKQFNEYRCMHCGAKKNMLRTIRHVHKKETIELCNDLEEQRIKCIEERKPIVLEA